MFCQWHITDNDCYRHIRNNGSTYEMVQSVWLDTTREDRARGLQEYCVCRGEINLDDYSKEEMEDYIYSYGYTMESLEKEYGDSMYNIIAECILEDYILCDSCVIADAISFDEAKEIIDKIINNTKLM